MISNMHLDFKMCSFINKPGQATCKANTILDYNKHMSGVDRSDQMLSYNSLLRKSLRWYKKVGVHMLEVFLVKAHYFYREQAAKLEDMKDLTLLEFREQIIVTLVGEDKREKEK